MIMMSGFSSHKCWVNKWYYPPPSLVVVCACRCFILSLSLSCFSSLSHFSVLSLSVSFSLTPIRSDKVFLKADKTTNIYKVSKEEYNKLLTENITKDYKKTTEKAVDKCNIEASKIAHTLKLERRIEAHGENKAFITLKDHKENFRDRPKCRLINPAKSQIGKISKQILEQLNKKIREKAGLQQWRSTAEALDWFNAITHKSRKRFLQLDIVEF